MATDEDKPNEEDVVISGGVRAEDEPVVIEAGPGGNVYVHGGAIVAGYGRGSITIRGGEGK